MQSTDTLSASVRVLYNQLDITRDITPYVQSVSYTDSVDQADDLQIALADPTGLWSGPWLPDKNARLTVEFISQLRSARSVLHCGTFFIDTVRDSGPPSVVTIKATSADLATNLRREEKTRAWEHVSLRKLFEDVAANGGLSLSYLANINPTYQRIEQKKESDLAFAQRLAANEDLRLKVAGASLVIFDVDEHASASEIVTFAKNGQTTVIGWELETQNSQAYSACVVKYRSPQKKALIEYAYRPPNPPEVGATLRVNQRCESIAQAQRVAKARLAAANRHVGTASMTVVGDTRLVAGANIRLDASWGSYAGKYAIEEAIHSLWPYATELKLRRLI